MVSRKAVSIRRAGYACVLAAALLMLGFLGRSLYAASDDLTPAEQICPTCPDSVETQATGIFCPTAATIMLTSLMAGLSLAGHTRRR